MRPSERPVDAMRTVTIETGVNRYAEGSCLISFGHTRVLVTASLEELTDAVVVHSQAGDLVLAMGAGDVNGLWGRLQQRQERSAAVPLAA